MKLRSLLFGLVLAGAGRAQWYAGAMGGLSTLSADGRTIITTESTAISLYKPENGPSLHLFAGKHWREYLSVQGSYVWNRNALQFTETRVEGGRESTFEQKRTSAQSAFSADGLIYFRPRSSRFRPYVSGGLGMVRLSSSAGPIVVSKGTVSLPPDQFAATRVFWRTAVGIDVRVAQGWRFRYSFWETLSANSISRELRPRGQRNLANFQNMFGFVREF
jgi:hypothetical protein